MAFLALLFAAGCLWAAFKTAAFGIWLVFAVLSVVFSIITFVVKHTFKLIAWIGIIVIALSLIVYFI